MYKSEAFRSKVALNCQEHLLLNVEQHVRQ